MKIVNYGEEILEIPTEKVTEFNEDLIKFTEDMISTCLLYTSPSPRD